MAFPSISLLMALLAQEDAARLGRIPRGSWGFIAGINMDGTVVRKRDIKIDQILLTVDRLAIVGEWLAGVGGHGSTPEFELYSSRSCIRECQTRLSTERKVGPAVKVDDFREREYGRCTGSVSLELGRALCDVAPVASGSVCQRALHLPADGLVRRHLRLRRSGNNKCDDDSPSDGCYMHFSSRLLERGPVDWFNLPRIFIEFDLLQRHRGRR
jgi:hypothetical protein